MLVDTVGLTQIFQFQATAARYQHYLGVQDPADPQITALLVAFSTGNEVHINVLGCRCKLDLSDYSLYILQVYCLFHDSNDCQQQALRTAHEVLLF